MIATRFTVAHGMSCFFEGANELRYQSPAVGKPSAGFSVVMAMVPQLRATP